MLKIKKRWILILFLELAQLTCLLGALSWFNAWLGDGLEASLSRQLTTLNDQVMHQPTPLDITTSVNNTLLIVNRVGVAVAGILFVFSSTLTALIIRRYESRLDAANAQLSSLVERRSSALMKTRDAVIFGLAKLAESRDDETGGHLERIQRYVDILGRAFMKHEPSLSECTISTIAMASSLHDIGKVGIPDSILLKPGRLTDKERQVMQQHPIIGGECLLAIKQRLGRDDFLTTACEIAFCHHERWDGTGYPYGLSGNSIPLSGRIVALADVYDALTSRRVYKEPVPHELASEIIIKASGSQFDPHIVEAFIECADEFAAIVEPAHGTIRLAKVA